MQYTPEEIRQYAAEEDVKFIRMAFCDVEGRQKNIAIMPGELDRAFRYGIAIDGSAIPGFGGEVHSDLLLYPDPSTLCVLPWKLNVTCSAGMKTESPHRFPMMRRAIWILPRRIRVKISGERSA